MASNKCIFVFLAVVVFSKTVDCRVTFYNIYFTLQRTITTLDGPYKTYIRIKASDTLSGHVLPKFEELTITNQSIPILPKGSVSNLPDIRSIKITYCNLKNIEAGAFEDLAQLEELELNHNLLEEIQVGMFNSVSTKVLNLRNNKISKIQDGAFRNISVEQLLLDNNRISQVSGDWLLGTPVVALSMANNLLRELPAGFVGPSDVEVFFYVFLNNNTLETIHADAFRGLKWLGYLYLQNNSLSVFEKGVFNGVEEISILALDDNQIREIKEGAFDGVNVHHLKVGNNLLSCLSENLVQNGNLTAFYVDNNPLTCECVDFWENYKKKNENDRLVDFDEVKCIVNANKIVQ